MRGRLAGDPGVLEQILGVIGDNPWTRAWNDATASLTRPVEHLVIGDRGVAENVQMRLAQRMVRDIQKNGQLSPELAELVRGHVNPQLLGEARGGGDRVQKLAEHWRGTPTTEDDAIAQVVGALENDVDYLPGRTGGPAGGIDMEKVEALRQALTEGRPQRAYTGPGEMNRQFGTGSPVAAYAIPGLGAAVTASLLLRGQQPEPVVVPEEEALRIR